MRAPAEAEFELPFDVRAIGRPPPFEMLRRCQWVSTAAPRLMPRDEVEACRCQPSPEALVAIAIARDAERTAMKKATAKQSGKREAAANTAAAALAVAGEGGAGGGTGSQGSGGGGSRGRDSTGSARTSPTAVAPAAAELAGTAVAVAAPAAAGAVAVARTGCGDNCLQRHCLSTCDTRVCPCGPSCSNRPFHLLTSPKTKTVLTENRGWGLFAAEAVADGAFVVEYTGEIIDDKTCEARLWADKTRGEDNFYLMEVFGGQVIDARHKGNLSRFINSSCHPNCVTQKWQDAGTGETRVGIFAIQDIAAGAELTYDYNFAHFGGGATLNPTP